MKIMTLDEVLENLGFPEYRREFWSKKFDEKYNDNFIDFVNTLYARIEIHEREDGVPELDIHIPFVPRKLKKEEKSKPIVAYSDNPHDLDYAYWH